MRGSIPVGEKAFEISGAMPNPAQQFEHSFLQQLQKDKIDWIPNSEPERFSEVLLYEHQSPNLDSLNYWFLHKSINLYGEAFLKTIGWQQMAKAATSAGIEAIKQFWQAKSISPHALNLHDGSGLSPQNRITCQALAQVMQYARSTPFFLRFRDDLPEINGLKMKDGYINGVRSYTGYCKSKTGSEYTFAFIINNFSGSAAQARIKMWKIIDLLK
jgi:serine-type D-Ala-D-Ala carboxypeptidase/endopeptidase (penicillin-binding protein 4)